MGGDKVRKLVLSILMSLIILMISSLFFISYAGFDANKSAVGFLDQNLPNYLNTIPNQYISRYSNFLGVYNLINANITLPSSDNLNNIYPFNSFNNSLLKEAVAYRTNNNQVTNNNQEELVPNAWFIRNQGTWYSLGFANIVSDFNFSQPNVTNPGNNYNAIMLWDPTLTPNYGIGITYNRTINLIQKNGNIIVISPITSFNNINHNFNAATIGDFNNDNIPDIFVIGSNEPNTGYAKINGAYSISGRRDAAGNLNFNTANTVTSSNRSNNSWDNVYVQWTSDAVKSRAWISQNGSLTKVPIDFNKDGREDLIIAGADGNIWYVPNTTPQGSSTITFGNPIKILDYNQTGMKTGVNASDTNGNIVIDVGDIDNDGRLDLVAATTDGAEIKIFKGNPNFNSNSNINNTNNSPFLANQQGVINLYSTRRQGNNYYSQMGDAVVSMEYRGPNTQRDPNTNGKPNAEYVGAANNITLVDFNRDGKLDIAITTDNFNFSPSDINNYTIKFTDRNNLTLASPGGRIYTFINNSSIQGNNLNIKFRGYFLGQYAISQDSRGNPFADFDGLSIMNLSNPSAFDIVATDGNHAQTLFSFEQFGNMFVYAARFVLTSKDLIINQGNEQDAYNYNRGRFYIKQATITIKGSIIGNNNGLNMIVYAANTINNNNPNWVETNSIPLNSALSGGQLIVDFDFYPNSNNVLYRINNGPWQSTNIRRNKGSSLVYRIEIRPTNYTTTTDLMGNNIRCLSDNINITGIQVSYITSPRTIRITNWKEVR
jgi:hypothetical protein